MGEIKMDLYTENQAQKERRAKRRTGNRFDKHNSIACLRRRVQTDCNPILEQRLQELERRDSQEIPTRSRKIYWGQEKNRLQAERDREENTRLMYKLLPGEKDEIEQLAPRTFLQEGILYRLKRNGDDLRIYANKKGNKSNVIVRGNIVDLEAVVKELRGVHNTLMYKERVKQVPNPPKPTLGSPNYLREVVEEDGEENDDEIVDCGYLVPTFSYVSPALQALGVKSVVVGFERIDAYGKPVAVREDYGLENDGEQVNNETVSVAREPRKVRKYISLAVGIALALANIFGNDIPQKECQQTTAPAGNTATPAVSLLQKGKLDINYLDDGTINEIRNWPGDDDTVYFINESQTKKQSLGRNVYFIKN